MKLLTFVPSSESSAAPLLGVLIDRDRTIVNLQAGSLLVAGAPKPFFADMLAFLDAGEAAREAAEQVRDFVITQRPPETTYSVSDVMLLSPVPRPRSIRDCLVFEKHLIYEGTLALLYRKTRLRIGVRHIDRQDWAKYHSGRGTQPHRWVRDLQRFQRP